MQDLNSTLNISSSSVVFDLNGHRLSCANSYVIQPWQGQQSGNGLVPDQLSIGIRVSDSLTGTIIKDSVGTGQIDGCQTAINTNGSVTITGVFIASAGLIGIQLGGSGSNIINGGTRISGVFGAPILISSNNNSVSNTTCSGNYGDINENSGGCVVTGSPTTGNSFSTMTISTGGNSAFKFKGASTVGWTSDHLTITGQKAGLIDFVSGAPPAWLGTSTNTLNGGAITIHPTCSGTYDGNSIGAQGYFYCATGTGVTVQNVVASESIWLDNCTTCTVTASTISNMSTQATPIKMTGSNLTASNNILTKIFNRVGESISLNGTGTLTASGNTISGSEGGIFISGSGTPVLSGNKYLNTMMTQTSGTGSVNEIFAYPTRYESGMLSWSDATRTLNVNDTTSFSFSMFLPDGSTTCASCTYTAVAYPTETVSSGKTGNTVTGSFVAHQAGLYSLLVTVTDSNNNLTKKNFFYFVGSLTALTSRLYFSNGQVFNVVNGGGMDAQPMLATPPTIVQWGYCNGWVQESPSDIVSFPFSLLTGVAMNLTYSTYPGRISQVPQSTTGLSRFTDYNGVPDSVPTPITTPAVPAFTFDVASPVFTGLTYAMDSTLAWNAISIILKTNGDPIHGTDFPDIMSATGSPAYADFSYSYPAVMPIKTISNNNVRVLSDTANTIVLDNSTNATASQSMNITGLTSNVAYDISVDGSVTGSVSTNSAGVTNVTVSLATGIHSIGITQSQARTNLLIAEK